MLVSCFAAPTAKSRNWVSQIHVAKPKEHDLRQKCLIQDLSQNKEETRRKQLKHKHTLFLSFQLNKKGYKMDLLFGKDDYDDDEDLSHLYDDELSMAHSASDCSSSLSGCSSFDDTPRTPESHKQRRPSLRKGLLQAFSSPVKAARDTLSQRNLLSPKNKGSSSSKSSKKLKLGSSIKQLSSKELKSWQEKFDLPPNTTQEQAMAVLLCRELEMIDI